MAKTYYKYAKRETDPVDYAGMAAGLSKGLMATVTGLEDKADEVADEVSKAKEKIDKEFKAEDDKKIKADEAADAQYGEKLNKVSGLPLSYQQDYKSVQSVILDLSAEAADWRAQLKKDVDSGKMTTKDYNRKVNNISDQFKLMKQTAMTSMDMVTSTNAGVESGDTLPIQQDFLRTLLSARFDSQNAEYKIAPDGNIYANITDQATGNVTQMSVHDLNKLSLQRFDTFDIDTQSDSLVKDIGAVMENYRSGGRTTEQLLKMEIMQTGNVINTPMDYINENVKGYNPNQLSSILQMKMGSRYKRSTDANDFGKEDVIVYAVNPLSGQYEAKLTDGQKEDAQDFARAQVLAKLNPLKKPEPSGPSDSERKAREERGKNIEAAKADVNNLKKIFEAKSEDEVVEALSAFAPNVIENLPKNSEFMRLESAVVGNSRSINAIYKDEYGKTVSMPIVVKIPDNFQAFVDEGGEKLTGNPNLLSLREESGVGANDQKGGKLGGTYKIDVLEENIPAFKSAVTLSDAMDAVESELDTSPYDPTGILNSAYTDMSTAAEDMFKVMDFGDYSITKDGDDILITVDGYNIPSFNTSIKSYGGVTGGGHGKRRTAFKKHMENIYAALTTGKKMGGTDKPAGKPSNTLNATDRNKK
jgi:hypothetical protein